MKVYDVLVAARAKIAEPEGWIKHFYAKDADGNIVAPTNSKATCWCSLGSVEAAMKGVPLNRSWGDLYGKSVDALAGVMGDNVAGFNDKNTHVEVLAAFDKAIESAKAA